MEFLLPVAAETLVTYLIGVKIMNGFRPVEELELTDDFMFMAVIRAFPSVLYKRLWMRQKSYWQQVYLKSRFQVVWICP